MATPVRGYAKDSEADSRFDREDQKYLISNMSPVEAGSENDTRGCIFNIPGVEDSRDRPSALSASELLYVSFSL